MARPRSEEARQKILDSAAELARDVGLRAFTIEEVARRSGVAKTTIYRHFSTKNELVVTAFDSVTPVPTVPDTGTLQSDLAQFLGEVLPIFASAEIRTFCFEVMAVGTFDPELAELQRGMLEGRSQALASIIERAKARGELPADLELSTAFEVIEGPLLFRGLVNPELLDEIDLDELAKTMIARLRI